MSKHQRARALLDRLEQYYPEARCELHYQTPWQLLVATILSAQCTDIRVNQVTPQLFQIVPGLREMAAADPSQIEELIRSTGFFRNKADNLIRCAQQLINLHQGEVPADLEALVALPGVGRKTANVVLGNAFQIPGMVVDTHVKRLAFRFGWTRATSPLQVERDLCRLFPADRWIQLNHTLIAHGRALCKAPSPYCSRCMMVELCPRHGVQHSR